jgi:hypothetical protein
MSPDLYAYENPRFANETLKRMATEEGFTQRLMRFQQDCRIIDRYHWWRMPLPAACYEKPVVGLVPRIARAGDVTPEERRALIRRSN